MEKLIKEELQKALSDLEVGKIYCFDSIGSTNDFGFERSSAGDPDMTIITAFEQTKGRGRMQRTWVTKPGTSLPMTVIIRPTSAEMAFLYLFSPLTGLALREALRKDYGISERDYNYRGILTDCGLMHFYKSSIAYWGMPHNYLSALSTPQCCIMDSIADWSSP